MYGSVKTNAQLSPTLKYIYVCIFVRTTKKGLAYESNPFKPASSSFISSVVLADIDATVLQPPIYRRGPPPGGMPMMPMLLPDGRIGYVLIKLACLSVTVVNSHSMPAVSSTSLSQSGILPSSNIIPNSSTFQSSNHASPMPSIHGIGSPTQSATEPLSGTALSPMKSSDITCTGQQSTTRTNLLIRDNARSSLCQLCYVEDDKCHVPFYELLRSGLQFIENIPDDEALFTLILEIHRWQDMMAMHMQMLDQHLHCPTFGNQRLLSQATTNVSGEAVTNMRYSSITYPSVLGEPLHGEVINFLLIIMKT
ncbi:hypothetical protein ACSBR2_037629 [Camellia fascicularis]